ncbi:uncharacterized protein LOC129976630 isoform X2 [Argiope bruennichi]|uniref:Sentrin-specific protease 7 like protein n=1 Tax=Argiope bruennichi TaxID=94029 RepID=A0A8T0ESQ5_ARGBR|nr:uncharacterized protein LOC129976630 isoform X2 [Argiope bruennichi]KAF8778284.1 Sentrin-specific protease 7 like protein [Argiope bruennichi]
MQRSTVETLKQIQKQGLSISIVNPDSARSSFSLDTSVSKETKPIVTIDKTPKLPTRSSVATESKATISQIKSVPNSSAEVRTAGGQSANQTSFQDAKIPGSITKSVNPIVTGSETRAFGSQSWSKSILSAPTENKAQGTSNLVVQPENKTPSGAGRNLQNSAAFSENKIQNTRTVPVISQVTDNKSQNRIGQIATLSESKNQGNQSRNQSQLTFEGKLQTGQGRINLSSPPLEVKTINSNQGRSSQNFSAVIHENKSSIGQRSVNSVLSNNQSKLNQNRPTEIKTSNPVRVTQTAKNISVEKLRPNVNEQASVSSPISERSLNNPFRVASTLGKKASASEEKAVVKVTRVSQNMSVVSENQSSTQSKISQNMSMHSENKAVSQVVKVSSVSSELSQKSSVSFDNSINNPITPVISTMSTPRGAAKRPQAVRVANSTPVAKKKCTKRASPSADAGAKRLQNMDASFSSEDGSSKDKQFFNMKGLTPGLTITPVGGSASSGTNPSTSGNAGKATVSGTTVSAVVSCPSCQQLSVNLHFCDSCHCRIPPNAQQIPLNRRTDVPAFVVTKNVTTSIQKQIVFQFQETNQACVQIQGKVMVETNQSVSPRAKGRPRTRRKFVEPVCYTLSSDEEEPVPVPFHPVIAETHPNVSQYFAGDSEGSKSEHSSASEVLHDENQEFDDPQFPGVTDINEQIEVEEEPEEEEEEMEFEGGREDEDFEESIEEEEEEEIPPEEPDEPDVIHGQKPTDYPLRCRSIRIGAYKVHPYNDLPYIPVNLSTEYISFRAPTIYDSKYVTLTIRCHDVTKVLVHFGRCLPIMFVYTTASFGESVRNSLRMNTSDEYFFDPGSRVEKVQKITFLIDAMTDEQRNFLRHCFPGDKKVKEIDQKEANEILVKSTPNQNNPPITSKLQAAQEQPAPVQIGPTQSQMTAQKVIPPHQPIIKLLTYPPPPQTGGIAITTEDLSCLNEGEFLNDAIIDFYLKYIFNEKLTPSQREKTHIFSSFFYPRLTHKPERPRPGDETNKNVQARRHNQVKTWTRHVDIFSKDFIIIPVNQNVHWFLAIICYPGKVPEVSESATRSEVRSNKSSDNVSSTVEQESSSGSKVIIRELSNNGEGDSLNQDENSTSSVNSTYLVEEPPDSDEPSPETPDSTTHPDGKQRKEMPCICIFDSLSGPNRWRIPATLREYLEMEWKMKKGTKKVFDRNTMQGFVMKCPQQTNFSDCGTYLLQFVESFFENPLPYFGNPMPDLTNWFSESKIAKKRNELRGLILSIHKNQVDIANARRGKPPDGVQVTPVTVQQTDNR